MDSQSLRRALDEWTQSTATSKGVDGARKSKL